MPKDSYWFRHDSNARNDVNMIRLMRLSGMQGVGAFWCIVEMLREAKGYKIPLTSIEDIEYDLRITDEIFSSLFECSLLSKDAEFFYSNSLLARMEAYEIMKEKRREAGAKGGKAKAKSKQKKANAKQMLSYKSIIEESGVEENRVENSRIEESVLEVEVENIYTSIILHWNTQTINLSKCKKLTQKHEAAINGLDADGYDKEQIMKGISNYNHIVNGPQYYFNYKWNLLDFLKRTNACRHFADLTDDKQYLTNQQSMRAEDIPMS